MSWRFQLPSDNPLYVTWLKETQKLSASLRDIFVNWRIQLLFQEHAFLSKSEADILAVTSDYSWQRMIVHLDDEVPLIIGRVVVPEVTFNRYQSELLDLKRKSIGDQLLFIDPKIQRSEFLFKKLSLKELHLKPLPRQLFDQEDDTLYARNSIFHLNGEYPLMVEEYFLASFFESLKART
ncbi:chorismate lyase [Thiotrichales bacterium 19S3-7]|nr:chorismate lyase [Thiotrichales bacterium 19S3-7]MCF6800952.1 chorismate lyase [Thiotrichales bacterium 19S3-11]